MPPQPPPPSRTPPISIYLDDEPLQIPRASLAVAVRIAVHEAQRRGRIVLQALRDGEALATEILENPPDEPIVGELRVISADPRELVASALVHAADAIDGQRATQMAIAKDLQAGRIEPALNQMHGLLSDWSALLQSIGQCHQMLQLPAARGEASEGVDGGGGVGGGGFRDMAVLVPVIEPIARELEDFKAALTREDWVALSDLLAYEVPERQVVRQRALRNLAERIQEGA